MDPAARSSTPPRPKTRGRPSSSDAPAKSTDAPEKSEPIFWFLPTKIEDVAKLVGLVGIALFGALFLCYERFYSTLGIDPEDVGDNYLYILSRSFGVILIITGIFVYFS